VALAKDEMAVHHVTVIVHHATAIVRDVTARDRRATVIVHATARDLHATARDLHVTVSVLLEMGKDHRATANGHRVRIRNDLLMMPCGSMRTVTESWTVRNFGHLRKKWDSVTDRHQKVADGQATARLVKAVQMAAVIVHSVRLLNSWKL